MKKIFTLFAAMLVAIAMNAAIDAGTGALSTAISAASDGAIIELNSGDFIETSSIDLTKNLTIKAAEGKTPIIKAKVFYPQGQKSIRFEGVKFDASAVTEYLFSAADKTNATILHFEDCEFYGDTANKALIRCGSSYKLDSLIVNNCYIHNITKSFIFIENTGTVNVKITNSTFANISTNTSSYWAGFIDSRAASGYFRVDNCTFYNVQAMNTDYAAIGKVSTAGAVVSNCIFAFPTSASGNYRAIRDKVTANNNLVFNYTADSGWGMQGDVTKNNCIKDQDPLFADTANCIFTLAETSPAKGTGVGGTNLGDPRWWPASWKPAEVVEVTSIELNKTSLSLEVDDVELLTATVLPDNATDPSVSWTSSNTSIAEVSGGLVSGKAIGTASIIATAGSKSDTCTVTITAAAKPSTDFASALTLLGKKAHLEGAIWKMYKDATYKLYGNGGDNKFYGTASWTIHVEKPCVVTGTLNGVEGGHIFVLDLYQGSDSLCSLEQPSGAEWWSGLIDMNGKLTFPAAGDYTLKLRNTQEWSSGKVAGITLTKEYDLIDIYLKAGVWHAGDAKFGVYDRGSSSWWPEFMENVEGDLYVFRNFPANKVYLNFVRFANTKVAPGEGDIWNQVVNLNREGDNNCMNITGWGDAGYSTGEWRKYFPGLEAGYYLVGTHNSWEPKAADILAKNGEEEEYMITKNAEEGDQFKAISIDANGFNAGWYPDGSDNEYTIPEELAGNVTIYFRPDGNNEWPDTNGGGKKFYVQRNGDPTAIDNTVVGEKAVKLMENGQLIIIKNGVRYNVLGTVIK